jgi:predicted phage terminase large subunit-like protein
MNARALIEIEAEEERRSFAVFAQRYWHIVEPSTPFVPTRLFEVLCGVLERAARGELQRILINVPPRCGKSTLVSVLLPAWVLTWRHQTRFLTASYGEGLAERDSARCRRLIESDLYQQRHGAAVRLRNDQNTKLRFETTLGGARVAVSVGGAATGEGGDILILDDPHKIEDARSPAALGRTVDWTQTTFATRLNDPRTGVVIIVMHRVSEHDLTPTLLAEGSYYHVCLPAEFDPGHPHRSPLDWRTTPGELLTPERFGRAEFERQVRSMSPYARAGQMQQLPAPAGGGIFEREWWRYYDPAELPSRVDDLVITWDTTQGSEVSGDYVAGQCWARIGANCYLLRQIHGRLNFNDTVEAMVALTEWARENYPRQIGAILVEGAANGPSAIQVLKGRLPGLIKTMPREKKVARADAVTTLFAGGNVFVPGAASIDGKTFDPARTPHWVQELIHEADTFPNGSHDDRVDAMTMALAYLSRRQPQVRALVGR